MKKIFIIITLFLITTISVKAQYSIPRWGTLPGRDATFRGLSNAWVAPSDTLVSRDTLKVYPNAYNTFIVNDTITDSLRINLKTTYSYLGDMVVCFINPGKITSKHFVVTQNGTINLGHFSSFTASTRKVFIWIFNGTGWTMVL